MTPDFDELASFIRLRLRKRALLIVLTALDDPMLMLGIDNGLVRNPLSFDGDEATSKVIGISQMVPFYGKRDLRRQGAVHEAAHVLGQLALHEGHHGLNGLFGLLGAEAQFVGKGLLKFVHVVTPI